MATLYGLMAIGLWGTLALLGTVTANIPAFQLLSLCFTLSAIIVIIKRIAVKKPVFTKPTLTLKQWLFGIIGLFGFHFCYFMALKFAPVIEVSLIVYLWPLLLATLVANKQSRFRALIGGCLGFIGIAFIIVGNSELTLNNDYRIGYLLAVICAIIWGSYSWFLSTSNNDVEDIAWLSAAVALLALIAHWQFETSNWSFSVAEWGGILLLGLGPVGGAFYLWDIALKKGNQQLLASLSFSTPLISSVILAIAGFNAWSTNIIIALALILSGAIIANTKTKLAAIKV
ncbi:MAG: EamA family transporter [Moritella sp.]|uniref:DMT family transporter n=1 Tax=Moritella sp. TaxID=78556 RepID=UPI001E056DD1|nr:EamA family transporter [Moritella sp.]NQZ52131.1 EamA family transporter [Moritella sp.]